MVGAEIRKRKVENRGQRSGFRNENRNLKAESRKVGAILNLMLRHQFHELTPMSIRRAEQGAKRRSQNHSVGMPHWPDAMRRRFIAGSTGLAPWALSQRISAAPLSSTGSWGTGRNFNGRLVLQIVTDIVFMVQFEIVDSPTQARFKALIQMPDLLEQAPSLSQHITVSRSVGSIVPGDVDVLTVVLHQHQPNHERNNFAFDHHERNDDVGTVTQPDAEIFGGHGERS